MIDDLEEMSLVKMAGLIGRFFQIDPVKVIDCDYTTYAVRAAAYRYVANKEAAEMEKARVAKAKAG